ncbi:RecQ family ATP-dependent DNA helicase [Candidatus Poriferisocius sp.]|uniref:RecQ family ATP-dependent DNA helicase n=1 Tax=Candidatus Poriferisocius sp. TaxID=3101276 RepID=UPI003B5C1E85
MSNRQAEFFSSEAHERLRALTNDQSSTFRPGQLEAIEQLVLQRTRVLLVQRTGWGKSAVYFIATRLLRDRGAGPTLLVSPLLALMRNQIEAALRMGVRATTINSSNQEEWEAVYAAIDSDRIDVLLISPERLANRDFRTEHLPSLARRGGLLVVDEVHCISDWGHDFRPDYRRIKGVLDLLPRSIPVLGCTATANDRVVDDVADQLGNELVRIRGPLGREGLRLRVYEPAHQQMRLAWLAETIPKLPGTGIVYCLTIRDADRVAAWLSSQGIIAVAYSGDSDNDRRLEIEQQLLGNQVKVVAATSALGMGFDKPDLSFVIHYQAPGSPIAYYQQVGRAGRNLADSWGILLQGYEDADIQNYFIDSAFPTIVQAHEIVGLLEQTASPLKLTEIERVVNVRRSRLHQLLKILEVDDAVERVPAGWQRTLQPWSYDSERVEAVTALRWGEQSQMAEYASTGQCRMNLLRSYLDDPHAHPCGICDNCLSDHRKLGAGSQAVQAAVDFLRESALSIEPRKQVPGEGRIPTDQRCEPGRVLALWRDGGWGALVQRGKAEGHFDDELVDASADLIRNRWKPDPAPTWVSYVPSRRHPALVRDLAQRIAQELGLPCHDAVDTAQDTQPQKFMQNSAKQYANIKDAFRIVPDVPSGPVLLVDDIVDSRWTFTVIAAQLRRSGARLVYPFALADTAGRSARD